MDEDVEIIARAARVLAEEALAIGLGDGGKEVLRLADEFAADVDIRGPRAHRETSDHRPLHHLRSEEPTSELQSLMRISYALFCWQKKNISDAQRNKRDTR